VHIEVDTGFCRNGFTFEDPDYKEALEVLRRCESSGQLKCEGIWSHLATADEVDNPESVKTTALQNSRFKEFIEFAEGLGVRPKFKHIAASASVFTSPEMHYDLVRPGITIYGYSPNPKTIDVSQYGLQKAMRLEAELANVKVIEAGSKVSYGHKYTVSERTNIGIVPLGYADGIPRSCGATDDNPGASVMVNGEIVPVIGRICMDQFMIDLGPNTTARAGDWVTLWGFDSGEPSAELWADAADTITYEILTQTNRNTSHS
jgi:alanine racemase